MQHRATCIGTMLSLAVTGFFGAASAAIQATDVTEPSVGAQATLEQRSIQPGPVLAAPRLTDPTGANPPLAASADCFNFDTNGALNGSLFIPPDPICAAGPDHIVVIGNTIIEWRPKDPLPAAPEFQSGLESFFSALPGPPVGPGTTLGTATFDPKVIYDQYNQRFVVIALEQWDVAAGNPSSESRILLAVSKTSDPNAGWWFHAIDSKLNIGGADHWADYPGLAVGDRALFITNNMFQFAAGGYVGGGSWLWIIDKNTAYAGPNNSVTFTVHDPYAAAGITTTTQPAHMFGVLPPGSDGRMLGTYLVSYSGLSDGVNEYVQVVEVTDPLSLAGGPFFYQQYVLAGNIDNTALGLPDAPQLGSPFAIEVNDRRALDAVWRDNNLLVCSTLLPPMGPDGLTTTAHWWRISTSVNPYPMADQGNVGAEDLGAATYTFFPSIMFDCELNMAIGFSACNSGIYAGAYYAWRLVGDPAGSISATETLRAGVAPYKRYFSGPRNRWGDYSGVALCPRGEADFWVFNEYAGPTGTPTVGSQGAEDGRWYTAVGNFRVKLPTAAGTSELATRLGQNIPNPFNPTTSIHFSLASPDRVSLAVYDAGGRLVRTLVDGRRGAGSHEVTWDGRDTRGVAQASGVYFYRLTTGSVDESKKMVLLK